MDVRIAQNRSRWGRVRLMQIAEALKDDRLTLRKAADGLGLAGIRSLQRYIDGTRLPDREHMRRIVLFFEGRVTPNDIYGLSELIEELRERRARRLAGRKSKPPHPELPFDKPEPDTREAA